ncbi:tail fiber assembly protein [Escherichia coli]|uniref:tail fiber assembly protein n=1 Tax=Escherichia coli TaxID=562 RepID=UPI0013564603|nr:tail fiber assembly protein [Escherichia coli]
MNFLWSASNNSFFPEPMAKDYESVGWDLSDAIPVDAEVYAEFTKYNPTKVRIAGNDGMPAWKDLPPPTQAEQVASAEAERQNSIESANGYMNSKQWPGKAALGRLNAYYREGDR